MKRRALACLALSTIACHGTSDSSGSAKIVLTDITSRLGLPKGARSGCVVFRDFTHSGHPDLILAPTDENGLFGGSLRLFKNRGNGTFAPSDLPVPMNDITACAAADVDGDGWVDLALVGQGKDSHNGVLLFLHNSGKDGLSFDAPASQPGFDIATPTVAGFFDYDGDGAPDLYVGARTGYGNNMNLPIDHCGYNDDNVHICCYFKSTPMQTPPAIFHNGGKGQFTKSALAIPANFNNAVGFIDWDGDGYPEVFESNDFGRNTFYRNQKGAALSDMLPGWKANDWNFGMGVAFGDFDHDGRWDVYSCNGGPDLFYFGNAAGAVDERSAQTGVADITRSHNCWSPLGLDLDNDGWMDLFIPNDAVLSSPDDLLKLASFSNALGNTDVPQADFVLHNQAGKHFDVTKLPHGPALRPGIGLVAAAFDDFDGDGFLDIVEVENTPSIEVRFFRNDTYAPGNHWLRVRLETKSGARDVENATVVLLDEQGKEIDRRATGTGGLGGSQSLLHFGLGGRASVPSAMVHWAGGRAQAVPGPIAADRVLEIVEDPK